MDFYDYFQANEGGLWQWEEQGEVVAIAGGNTIAYRELLRALLDVLAEQGIPPFGALLLTLVATNPDAETTLDFSERDVANRSDAAGYNAEVTSAFAFLRNLAAVPATYKTGRKRLLLLQAIFADSHNSVGSAKAKALVRQFSNREFDVDKILIVKTSRRSPIMAELRVLALMSRRFPTVKSLLQKIADVPDLPEPVLPDDSAPETRTPTDFIQALLAEPKTFDVGALVKRLWSGLAIPFQNALPSEQPVGGVSDLTNKGDLSRLLVSEFANDDLIFLSRLANNEALYLNREVPPATDSRDRVVLIDVSLKNWGTPKTIAFAITVALARHPKTTARCIAFSVGNTCDALDFSSLDSIIDGLQVLAGCLHPAPGLADFFRNYAPVGPAEIFFISSPGTVRLVAMQQALSQYQSEIGWQILTDANGTISLYRHQRSGRKHVQDLALPLADLWKDKPATPRPAKTDAHNRPEAPRNYPILFPMNLNKRRKLMQTNDGEIFQISDEKSLFRVDTSKGLHQKGWQLLYENVPLTAGETEIGQLANGQYVLFAFNTNSREISLLNSTTHILQAAHFADWQSSAYPNFFYYAANQSFYFLTREAHWTFSATPELSIVKKAITPSVLLTTPQQSIVGQDRLHRELVELYEAETNQRDSLAQLNWPTTSLLKNVNTVFINEAGNLVLNHHELKLMNRDVMKFKVTRQSQRRYEATDLGQQTFGFADGSTATVNRAGMLILTSSNAAIPPIYMPLVLDSALGVATDTVFAAAGYYRLTDLEQEVQSARDFWVNFIVPFIETITKHGTNP
jgi:hypothetical protein